MRLETTPTANFPDCRHRCTTFATTSHEVSRLPEEPESGRKSCAPPYSAITANPVFSPDKAKTEKKKIFLILCDVFSVRAFVRFIGNGAPNCRLHCPFSAMGRAFPATLWQIFAKFRKQVRGLKLYYGALISRTSWLTMSLG